MIRLCIIHNDELFQINLEKDTSRDVFTPLAKWMPLRIENNRLLLPAGWHLADDIAQAEINLQHESNHSITDGTHFSLIMIRIFSNDSFTDEFVQAKEHFSVGRSQSNAICYRDGYMSSYHGIFRFTPDGKISYEDTSSNGTFVNGNLLHDNSCLIKSGDQLDFPPLLRITFHDTLLHIRYPSCHAFVSLQPITPCADNMVHAAIYMPDIAQLRYIEISKGKYNMQALREIVYSMLPPEDAALLPMNAVLLPAHKVTPTAAGETLEINDNAYFMLC